MFKIISLGFAILYRTEGAWLNDAQFVISDGNKGIQSSVLEGLSGASRQRCQIPFFG